jgi:hypothetical protein
LYATKAGLCMVIFQAAVAGRFLTFDFFRLTFLVDD